MINSITLDTIDIFLEKYTVARNGALNENTDSEAMFMISGRFCGVYYLHTGLGIYWVGLQNSTGRLTQDGRGKSYESVRCALKDALRLYPADVFYSDDSVERLRWLAARVSEYKAMGGVLITMHADNP